MADFNASLPRLVLTHDELIELARIATGVDAPATASTGLREAGLVDPELGVDPIAAKLAEVAVAAWRSVVLERFDGRTMTPLFVGWHPDGRATLSEPDAEGRVVVTGSQVQLLPALISQWLSLRARPELEGRTSIATTAGVIDTHINGGGGVEPTGDAALDGVIAKWRLSWRANGGYGESAPDISVTVVDTGDLGVWQVERSGAAGTPDEVVTLVPITVKQALDLLGDVVTGRKSPAPVPQPVA